MSHNDSNDECHIDSYDKCHNDSYDECHNDTFVPEIFLSFLHVVNKTSRNHH